MGRGRKQKKNTEVVKTKGRLERKTEDMGWRGSWDAQGGQADWKVAYRE